MEILRCRSGQFDGVVVVVVVCVWGGGGGGRLLQHLKATEKFMHD